MFCPLVVVFLIYIAPLTAVAIQLCVASLTARPTVCLPTCLPVCLLCICEYRSLPLSVVSLCMCICLSASVCRSVCLCLSGWLPLSDCLSVSLSLSLSLCLSF